MNCSRARCQKIYLIPLDVKTNYSNTTIYHPLSATSVPSQEKRRRAAGQRHWEEWVARKARGCKDDRHDRPTDDGASGGGRSGRRGDAEAARRRRQERADAELRKREQDDAFAAWVREKDKALRARRREVCAHSHKRSVNSTVTCRKREVLSFSP